MPMRGFLFLLVLEIVTAPGANSDSASQPVNVIMASKGWQVGKLSIAAGQQLPATATLTTSEPGELVLNCPQNGVLSYSCNKYPCHVSACAAQGSDVTVRRIDKGAESGSLPSPSLIQSFLGLLSRESQPPVTLGVRGSGGDPRDAVVLQDGGAVHLAPALIRVLEGEYCFGLTSLNSTGDRSVIVFRLVWNKSDEPEGIVKLPNVQPGPYALEKQALDASGTCSADPKAVPAWILVAPESDFENLKTRWKSNQAWLDQLSNSGVNPAAVMAMRHMAITDLSESLKH